MKTGVLSQVLYFIANSLTCRGGWFVYVLLTHCPFAVLQHKDYHVFNSLSFWLTLEEFYHWCNLKKHKAYDSHLNAL